MHVIVELSLFVAKFIQLVKELVAFSGIPFLYILTFTFLKKCKWLG
jgi:hypothetical protein